VEPARAAQLRDEMIERQLVRRGIRDQAVLSAMRSLPRELFVPQEIREDAYRDDALPIPSGQTISQPFIVARMTELLAPRKGMRVLEVGTGSGYQAAVLATIGCEVISIERHPGLAETARGRMSGLGLDGHVRIVVGDGSLGWPAAAPFEGIIVTAAAPRVPPTLRAQLADGGRLVVPVGTARAQDLIGVMRLGEAFDERSFGGCVFVPLVGAEGFSVEAIEDDSPDTSQDSSPEWL
jgi:protein-L-isoaspartate(D-aspartate) O-methyltransferase